MLEKSNYYTSIVEEGKKLRQDYERKSKFLKSIGKIFGAIIISLIANIVNSYVVKIDEVITILAFLITIVISVILILLKVNDQIKSIFFTTSYVVYGMVLCGIKACNTKELILETVILLIIFAILVFIIYLNEILQKTLITILVLSFIPITYFGYLTEQPHWILGFLSLFFYINIIYDNIKKQKKLICDKNNSDEIVKKQELKFIYTTYLWLIALLITL